MNNKVALGLVAAIIILVGVYFFLNRPPYTPAVLTPTATSTVATSTSLTSKSGPVLPAPSTASKPTVTIAPAVKVAKTAEFTTTSLVTNSPWPLIEGTANVPQVAIVIDNSADVGLAGSADIFVENGHWTYSAPAKLTPGVYKLHLYGGEHVVHATLTVTP